MLCILIQSGNRALYYFTFTHIFFPPSRHVIHQSNVLCYYQMDQRIHTMMTAGGWNKKEKKKKKNRKERKNNSTLFSEYGVSAGCVCQCLRTSASATGRTKAHTHTHTTPLLLRLTLYFYGSGYNVPQSSKCHERQQFGSSCSSICLLCDYISRTLMLAAMNESNSH